VEQKEISLRKLSAKPGEEREKWRQIRDLCCRTGNGGAPIADERWPFFGRLWIGPYERIIPHWTYTASVNDTIVGYLTGCPDTAEFTRARLWQFTLPLLVDVLRGNYRGSADQRNFLRQLFLMERTPEQYFPLGLRRDLKNRFPAHLHVNIEAGWRNKGIGARLVDAFLHDLQIARIEGVHLYCGPAPVEFYRSCGFTDLMRITIRNTSVHALGLRLRQPLAPAALDASSRAS
jgi:GNAT superfamily N-acetyltransferase